VHWPAVDGPTLQSDPEVKIKNSRGGAKAATACRSTGIAVFVDLPTKRLAQRDEVSALFSRPRRFLNGRVEPEIHPIKKVKATPIDYVVAGRFVLPKKIVAEIIRLKPSTIL
jgi:hypothetical protein